MRPTFSHNKPLPYRLLLYTTLLLHLFSTYCDDSATLFQGNLPSTVKIPAFPLNPGVTKSLTFTLSGVVDKLTISFVEDTYEIDSYLLTIKNNALPDTTQSTTFNATENLTISLNTKTNLLVIQGDINFRLSKIVREKSYSIQVVQELVQIDNTTSQDLQNLGGQTGQTSSKGNSSYYILAGVLGGLIGIIVVVKIGLYLKNRYKNRKHKRSSKKKPSNAREVHPDIPSPTPVFMLEDHSPEIFQKGSINLDDKGMSDNDIDVVHQHMMNHKKEILSSLGSIEYGMSKTTAVSSSTSNVSSGLVASNGSIPSVARDLESSRIKRPEPPSKKGTRLESITEEPSFLKPTAPAGDSGRKERDEVKTKGVVEGSQQMQQKPKAGLKLPKLVIENKSKSHHGGYLEPPEQASKVDNSPQKPITMGDIQKLVNKVMLEKRRSNESMEVSDSEEEEEQDLRPEPANFFCCMVCKAEKRSTVAEPCGHIFACEKCVRKIVANSKGCQLCSRRVRGYQNMKNN